VSGDILSVFGLAHQMNGSITRWDSKILSFHSFDDSQSFRSRKPGVYILPTCPNLKFSALPLRSLRLCCKGIERISTAEPLNRRERRDYGEKTSKLGHHPKFSRLLDTPIGRRYPFRFRSQRGASPRVICLSRFRTN
jgi:hypothetical protein